MRHILLVVSSVFLFLFCIVPSARSQTLPSPTPPYILFIEPITVSSQPAQSHFLSSEEERIWQSQGYVVRIHEDTPTTFTIQKTRLPFDDLTPDKPRINTTEFSLTSPEETPFQIQLSLIKPLVAMDDNSTHLAVKWEDVAGPKWGYSLNGTNWNESLTQDKSMILLRTYGSEKKTSSRMTWKIQADERTEETYTAVVSLVALPY